MTKAAALMATTEFATKLKDEGFVVVSLGPGLVDTTATAGADGRSTVLLGRCALLIWTPLGDVLTQRINAFAAMVKNVGGIQIPAQTPEVSVAAQLRLVDGLQPSQNGAFLSHTDEEHCPPS